VLEVRNLTKVFPNGTRALDDLSITIPDGQFVVVIGLSGSGKSTFLRCINRLVEPTSGKVILHGEDVTAAGSDRLRQIRGQIGMIFQQFNLIRRESVLTNVLTGALGTTSEPASLVGRWPKQEVERALHNLERVGIAEKARQRADTLSGGQQQRVAIARTLMQRPRLLLADEPVASLDPATSHSVMRYVEQINKEDGITVICNLHFLSLARRYAQRVLALKDGELVADLDPHAIDQQKFREIYGEDAVEVEVN
jgi:phosphonate transport system ATP-binding protein